MTSPLENGKSALVVQSLFKLPTASVIQRCLQFAPSRAIRQDAQTA